MHQCDNCGEKIISGMRFCPSCGYATGEDRASAAGAYEYGDSWVKQEQEKEKKQRGQGDYESKQAKSDRRETNAGHESGREYGSASDRFRAGARRAGGFGHVYEDGNSSGYTSNDYTVYESGEYDPRDATVNRAMSYLCYLGFLVFIPMFLRRHSPFVRFHTNQGLLLLITAILSNVVAWVIPVFGWLVRLVLGIFCFVCMIKGLKSVSRGTTERLPVIGMLDIYTW